MGSDGEDTFDGPLLTPGGDVVMSPSAMVLLFVTGGPGFDDLPIWRRSVCLHSAAAGWLATADGPQGNAVARGGRLPLTTN